MDFTWKLFHLIHSKHITNQTIHRLLEKDPHLTNLYTMPTNTLQQILQFDSNRMVQFSRDFNSIKVDKLMNFYKEKDISYITINDHAYPPLLKEIYNPPLILFLKGDQKLLMKNCLAIVGARDADQYSYNALGILLPAIISKQIVIVSGLAKGADTFAHKRTIEFGGKTIAVLGGGFFHLYPRENLKLAKEIEKEHLLISEYPPIKRPEKWHFPMRNRIIAGLSKGTIILQAKKRSGSLITADLALESGRDVFALPGPMNHPLSEGTNHLVQQGAKLILTSADVLDELNI